MQKSEIIAHAIFDIIKKEEKFLAKHNQGVFYLKELSLCYLVIKELFETKRIFNYEEFTFLQEANNEFSKRIDLLVQSKSEEYVFEFKMDDTSHSYIKDIIKLSKIKNAEKYFCAIKRVLNKEQGDSFINTIKSNLEVLEKNISLDLIIEKNDFETIVSSTGNKERCLFMFWKIN